MGTTRTNSTVGTYMEVFHPFGHIRQCQIDVVRVVRLGPRQASVMTPQFRVEMEESVTRRLGHADDLLEQVSEVLDVLRLLSQEARLYHVRQGVVPALAGQAAEPLEVFKQSLLCVESLQDRPHRFHGVLRPLDLRGLDVRWLAAPATLDEVFLEPECIGETLRRGTFP